MEIYSRDMEPTGKPQKPARMEVTLSPRLLSLLRQLQTSPACASSSPTFDEGLQGQYLRRIREELYAIQETCGVAHWPPPVAGGPQADGDAAGEASFSADEDGERLGWMVLLLKLHQTFASLLAPASSEEGEEARENGDVSSRRPQSPGKRRSPLLGKQSPSASKGWRIQTNEFEISSLWQILQAAPGGGGTSPDVVPRGGDRGPVPSGPGCAAAILSSNLSGLLTRQGSLADPRVGSAASGGLEAHTESRTEPGLWASLPALHRPGGDRPEEALPFDLVFELRRGCWTSVCRQQQAAQLRELQHQQSQLTSSFLHSRPSSFRSLGSSSLPSSSTPCGFPFSTGAPHAVDAGGTSPLAVPDAASDLGGSRGFGGPQPQISRPVCPFCAPSLASLVQVEERGDSTISGASRLRVTLAIDSEVLHFCCCSGGRFDAYFTALVAHLILAGCGAQGKGHLCPAPPASAASESLCDGRAKDAKPGESGDKKLQVPGGRDPRKAVGEENEKHSSGSKNRRRGANRAQRVSRGSPVSPSAAAYQSREEGREEANLGRNKENSVSSPETRLSLSHLGDNMPNGCGAVPSTPLGDSVELEPSPSSPASAGDPASQASALSRLTAAFVSRLRFPDFFPSTEAMVTRRAHHAMRVVLDSSRSGLTPGEAAAGGRGGSVGCWRMTKEKFNWHVTLLTSAAVEAVRDCFADLTLDVWHSCFYGSAAQVTGAKCASRDRLEQLLIALLGNNDALIRLEAVKLLNAFYDRHDWQLRQPFVPVIKNVGDRFVLSVLIETCTLCDDATSKEPSDVFAIVAAPSFSRFSTAEIYSYHTFSWVLLQSLSSPQSAAEHPSVSAEAGDTSRQWRKQRWLGTADFGVFTRCGFYDWRICRAKESDGSWWVVERAVSYGALSGQSTAPFPTASAAVLSAPLVPAEPADASVEEKMENSGDVSAQKRRVSRRLAAEAAAGAAAAHAAAAALDAAFPMKSPNPHHLRLLKRFEEQRQFDAATSSRANYDHRKKLLDECIPLQGRVVVLPKDSRNLQLHEVFVDSHEAQWDEETGKLTQRGNFACIAESLPTLAEAGVTATLVSGVMERDSGDVVYDVDGDFDYANPDASPFASVCRAAPCGLLGGVGGFLEVVQEARRVGMKILVQMASGVSASHPHRRYASHLLHFEDADGKKQILYGGETLGVLPQETAILNYRKLETWQLFIDDLKMWIKKFGIDGVRISNAQELPQILAADAHALSRKDADGQFHYAAQDIIMGEVVVPHSSSLGGYWSLASLGAPSFSALASFRSASSLLSVPAGFAYANPFYVKLCRSVWLESPDFLFIGECWTELEQLRHLQDMQATHATQASPLQSLGLGTVPAVSELPGHRSGEIPTLASLSATEFSVVPSLLVSSGIVPQMQLFPTVLPAVLGKKPAILPLCPSSHEGNSACMEAASLRQTQLRTPLLSLPPRFLFSALFAMHHNLPRGSILIQSSCTPASPLPALVYGRAAWAAVDLLMLLPDVPCTVAGEMQGSACRLGVPNVFAPDTSAGRLAALTGISGGPLGPNKLSFSPFPSPDAVGLLRYSSRYGAGFGDGGASRRPFFQRPNRLWSRQGTLKSLDAPKLPFRSHAGSLHMNYPGIPEGDSGGFREGRKLPGSAADESLQEQQSRPPHFDLPLLERVRLIDGFESIQKMPMLEQDVQDAVLGSPDDGTNGKFDLKSIHQHYAERRKLRHTEPCLRRGRVVLVDVRNPDGSSLTQAHRVYEQWPEALSDFDASLPALAAASACMHALSADVPSERKSRSRLLREAGVSAFAHPDEGDTVTGECPEAEGGDKVVAFVRFDDHRIRQQIEQFSAAGLSTCLGHASREKSQPPTVGRTQNRLTASRDRSRELHAREASSVQSESSRRKGEVAGEEYPAVSSSSVGVDFERSGHSLVLVVTNLSDRTLHDKSVSLQALRPAFRQQRIKHWHFLLQMCDLRSCNCEANLATFLACHETLQHPGLPNASLRSGGAHGKAGHPCNASARTSILPDVISIEELLSEPFLLPAMPPYSSVIRGFTLLPLTPPSQAPPAPVSLACSPSLYTSLFCCSLLRLQGLLRRLIHQSPGGSLAGVAQSRKSLARGNMILHILSQVAGDTLFAKAGEKASVAELDLFAEFLDELGFALNYREHCLGEKQRQEEGPHAEEESRPSASLSLFSICSDSKIFERHEELACSFMARLKRLVAGKTLQAPPSSHSDPVPPGDSSPIALANEVLEKNALGAICFVTPELGRWSTVGGLGVMVDELSTTLATELGQEVWVVSPYYDRNRKGEQDYLARDGIHHAFNVTVNVGGESITLGVHTGSVVSGVKLFFLHCASVFPCIYPDVYGLEQIRFIVTFAKAALEIFCHLGTIPPLIITNDWPTCLIPAYAKQRFFGSVFDCTTFYHIIHNLDSSYEGRIYLNKREDVYWLHGLPTDLLVDPHWHNFVINPSRCVLLQCDGWGTVSPSYRDELMNEGGKGNASPLAPLLRRHHHPFATPNGIPIKLRLERLKKLGFRNHWEAKAALQRHYFNFEKGDESIPLLAFIGRITQQKGVHLIVELAENLIRRYNGRVQILVGGMANWNDGYAARCANQMMDLRARFPHSFWADPGEFFCNGALVNLGADFGLMPSLFEPGGIVQHEFFIAGTPVVAFRTGGLKDTVREGSVTPGLGGGKISVESARQNNGFTFDAYTAGDFLFAIERALRVFSDRAKYEQLRANARASVVSCEESARAWLGEFARLRKKIPVNEKRVQEIFERLPDWSEAEWRLRRGTAPAFSSFLPSFSSESPVKPPAGTVVASLPRGPIPTSPFPPATLLGLLQFCEDREMHMHAADRAVQLGGRAGLSPRGDSFDVSPISEESEGSADEVRRRELRESPENEGEETGRQDGDRDGASGPASGEKREGNARKSASARTADALLPCRIKYVPVPGKPRPRSVAVAGTFDDWRVRRPLSWDNALQAFVLSLALRPGRYLYKLVVDGEWVCVSDAPQETDSLGNTNNFLQVP